MIMSLEIAGPDTRRSSLHKTCKINVVPPRGGLQRSPLRKHRLKQACPSRALPAGARRGRGQLRRRRSAGRCRGAAGAERARPRSPAPARLSPARFGFNNRQLRPVRTSFPSAPAPHGGGTRARPGTSRGRYRLPPAPGSEPRSRRTGAGGARARRCRSARGGGAGRGRAGAAARERSPRRPGPRPPHTKAAPRLSPRPPAPPRSHL